jgi:hypothetical protein
VAATDPAEKEKMLSLALEELRRTYDHINNIYDQLRVKVLALIGGEVAIVTLLFAIGMPLPRTVYGAIFLAAGLLFLSLAFALLLWIVSTVQWKIPVDMDEVASIYKRYNDAIGFLEYLRDDYIKCINHCAGHVSNRAKRFNWAIYVLCAGVIIIMVIKFGGMNI